MNTWLKTKWAFFWKLNGTKLLGFGGMILGFLSLIDLETVNVIGSTFGPVWGPRVTHGFAIFGGLMTAYRGFKNSQRQ